MSTPFMNLTLPTPSSTPGPGWASLLNNALSVVDAHDHTPGFGLPITPAALNINDDLDLQGHGLQTAQLINLSTNLAALATPSILHSVNGDLVWINANGTAVPITSGNAIVGAPGNIENLTPPASAAYDSGSSSFRWFSASGVMAGHDLGFAIFRQGFGSTAASISLRAPSSGVTTQTMNLAPTLPLSTGGALVGRAAGSVVSLGYAYLDGTTLEEATVGGNATWRVKDLGITTAKLAGSSVTTAKIATGNVTGGTSGMTPTGSIAYRTVTQLNIALNAITAFELDNGAVIDTKLGTGAVTETKLGTGAVTETKLGTGAVTTTKVADLNVTTVKIADLNVTTAKIADLNVTTAKIANLNVTTAKIADSNVTTAKIANLNVTTGKIADDAVTVDKIGVAYAWGLNGFSATNANLNATDTITYPAWVTGQTPNLAISGGKSFRITMQPQDSSGTARFYGYNVGATADLTVSIRIRLRRASDNAILREYIRQTYMPAANAGVYSYQTIEVPHCIIDLTPPTDTYYCTSEIFSNYYGLVRFWFDNWTTTLSQL